MLAVEKSFLSLLFKKKKTFMKEVFENSILRVCMNEMVLNSPTPLTSCLAKYIPFVRQGKTQKDTLNLSRHQSRDLTKTAS